MSKLAPVVARLRRTESVGEVVRAVFETAIPALGAERAVFELHADGRPLVWIASDAADRAHARAYLREGHREDPCLAALHDAHATVATDDFRIGHNPLAPAAHVVVGPIIGDGRLIGALRLVARWPVTVELRRATGAVCTHVSVRLAELGVTAAPADEFAALTARQRAIVEDVTRGRTTGEIAASLQISPNTVKKHLKAVYSRVGVANRAELAGRASRQPRRGSADDLRGSGLHATWRWDGQDAGA